ncbi:MAG TPA: 2-dehydropantoate 2-reductase N-terminal domain-containing protein [Candidatus Limnocylindrales bacterium]
MRFVVYGAGAIGGSLGALLSAAGEEVVLIARGAHLEAMRDKGLRLVSPDGDAVRRIEAVGGPEEIGWRHDDVVLMAMKTQDTEAALVRLPPGVAVVSVQNAVANERMMLRHFDGVYGVCVMFPTSHLEPGVVVVHSTPVPGILDIGRFPSGVDDRAEAIAAAFRRAGFRSEPQPDIMRLKYTKLLMNLGNAVEALCPPSPERQDIAARLRQEARGVLDAAGIGYAGEEENRAYRGDAITVKDIAGQPRSGSSSWQSLARGTGTIEADYLNGEIVLLGRLYGVPVKWNENAQRRARDAARQHAAPGSLTTAEWLSSLDLVG